MGVENLPSSTYTTNCDNAQFFRELEILIKLNHPCIVRILAFVVPNMSGWGDAHTGLDEIHTEFAENGSLQSVLKRGKEGRVPSFWNPLGIGIITCGMVLRMRFVHSSGFIHRDLSNSSVHYAALHGTTTAKNYTEQFGSLRCTGTVSGRVRMNEES
jgi:serine/threonine protein kinase